MDAFKLPSGNQVKLAETPPPPPTPRQVVSFINDKFSFRENEVAKLLLKGLSTKIISKQLSIKEGTVKFHITNIFKLDGVSKRSEFIVKHLNSEK